MQIAVVVAVTAGVFILCRRQFQQSGAGVWRQIFFTLAAAVIAVVAGLLAERLLFVQGLSVRTLRLWVIITAMGLLVLGRRALAAHGLEAGGVAQTLAAWPGWRATFRSPSAGRWPAWR